ncbi:MAG: hypothetical protein LBH18_04335 [Spirochaetaceae bacterium]|jgi:hypothetical protein|nr:hypothetical protein [Spirochaetaceae bacterium]
MKKISVYLTLFFALCAVDVSAQELNYTVDEAVQLLENNFSKYPWAHLYYNRKIHDDSSSSTKVARQAYDDGEIVTMIITYGGWRYEVKINFITEKQIFSKRSYDIQKVVLHSMDDLISRLPRNNNREEIQTQ